MKDIVGTSGLRSYLWGLLAWEIAVILPLAVVFANAGRKLRLEDLKLLSVVIAFGTLVVAICAWVGSRFRGVTSVLLGFGAGILCAVIGGVLWASHVSGFETRPAVFIGCLLLSVPSGIGGAIAGWFGQRAIRRMEQTFG